MKLLLRPSRVDLVQQGILPSASTPPSFHQQKVKLERARMGDVLKHKIEQRPDKQQLVSQHILLCESSAVDPGIQEKQRQLKKCKLADSLNDKLAHRPGPLELVQENILHVDEALEQAVKDGRLQFKPTSAGTAQKHPNPVFLVQELSEGLASHQQNNGEIPRQTVVLAPVEVPTEVLPVSSIYHSPECSSRTMSAPGTPSGPTSNSQPNIIPSTSIPSAPPLPVGGVTATGSSSGSHILKAKPKFKKPKSSNSKTAAIPSAGAGASTAAAAGSGGSNSGKSKIIKFHEYKGPSISNKGSLIYKLT